MVLIIMQSVFCSRPFNSSGRNAGSFRHLGELSEPRSRPYHSPCSLPMCYSPLTPGLSGLSTFSCAVGWAAQPVPLLPPLLCHLLNTSPEGLCNSKAKNNFFPHSLELYSWLIQSKSLGPRDRVLIKLNLGYNYSSPLQKRCTGRLYFLTFLWLVLSFQGGERMYQCLNRP